MVVLKEEARKVIENIVTKMLKEEGEVNSVNLLNNFKTEVKRRLENINIILTYNQNDYYFNLRNFTTITTNSEKNPNLIKTFQISGVTKNNKGIDVYLILNYNVKTKQLVVYDMNMKQQALSVLNQSDVISIVSELMRKYNIFLE